MSQINPFSALYYVKQNKGKCAFCIVMLVLASMMFLTGNYISSVAYTFDREQEYFDKLVVASLQSTDKEFRDYAAFREAVLADDKLECVDVTAYGFFVMDHGTVMNLAMVNDTFVFNSVEDMEKVFAHLGIHGDFSACGNYSMILGENFAKNKKLKLGDLVDKSVDENVQGEYRLNAITDDTSYCTYLIYEDSDNLGRLYIYSDTMEGKELYDYVKNLAKDKKVMVYDSTRETLSSSMSIFYVIFYTVAILVGLVMAVTVHSVMSGQYMKRIYEFGVYRALGISKRGLKNKVLTEILLMDLLGNVIGLFVILIYTYLANELYYEPIGLHLLMVSKTGIMGIVLCNAMILIPLIIAIGNMMCKADVTEF